MLLDTVRKLIIKIIINWLSYIIAKYKVLKKNNFMELPDGLCETSIKILNNIIKELCDYNKEI